MLFKQEHINPILFGNKTTTRRAWKKPMVKVGGIYKCKTKMFSKDFFAKIKVTKLFKQKLGDMFGDDYSKEGYDSYKGFRRVWEEINGSWDDDLEVYVIEFEVIKSN